MSRQSKLAFVFVSAALLSALCLMLPDLLWQAASAEVQGPTAAWLDAEPEARASRAAGSAMVSGSQTDFALPVAVDGPGETPATTSSDTTAKPPEMAAHPSPQTGPGPGELQRGYYQQVQRRLAAFATALPETAIGEARLRFTVESDGGIRDLQLARASGDAVLDRAALGLVRSAIPLPAPPQGLALTLEVPIWAR